MFEKKALKAFYTSQEEAVFYFDKSGLSEFFDRFVSALPRNVRILFPIKSFPNKEILALASKYFHGFDFTNLEEYSLARDFISSKHILWCSSNFSFDTNSIDHDGSLFSDNSYIFGDSRVNPSLRLMLPEVVKSSNFGFTKKEGLKLRVDFNAVHFHDSLYKPRDTWMEDVFKNLGEFQGVKHVNLGGGFYNYSFDEAIEKINEIALAWPSKTIFFEPGRWLVSSFGVLFGRVLDVKESNGAIRVVSTLSRECHLKWMEENLKIRFHKFKSSEKHNLDNADTTYQYRLVGPTCSESDLIGEFKLAAPPPSPGDFISLFGINGYCTAWNRSFNGFGKAKVVIF